MADQRQAGTIYDLGYQRYTGARLGRGYAFRTLFAHAFRTAFGAGRGQKAQQLPVIAVMLVIAPAIIQVGIAAATGSTQVINYAQQLQFTAFVLALFTAGQAPEVIVGDRELGTLSLYLSRSLHTTDYAMAKLLALFTAIGVLTFGPQLVMFGGKVLLNEAPWTAFKNEAEMLLPIAAGTLLAAFYLAAVGLSLASIARKRNSASAIVVAFFIVLPTVSALAIDIAKGDVKRYMVLLNPFLLMTGFANWMFDVQARRGMVGRAELPGEYYAYAIIGTCMLAVIGLAFRYRKAEE